MAYEAPTPRTIEQPVRYSPLQSQFLARLLRLKAMRAMEASPYRSWSGDVLLDRVAYGAWRDCQDAGVGMEAQFIVGTGMR